MSNLYNMENVEIKKAVSEIIDYLGEYEGFDEWWGHNLDNDYIENKLYKIIKDRYNLIQLKKMKTLI